MAMINICRQAARTAVRSLVTPFRALSYSGDGQQPWAEGGGGGGGGGNQFGGGNNYEKPPMRFQPRRGQERRPGDW